MATSSSETTNSLVDRLLEAAKREPLLMIPGPVEASPSIKKILAIQPLNHTGTLCIQSTGSALKKMRQVWKADEKAQPFIIPGSGTLAMEIAARNLLSPGERALVLSIGFFGDRFVDMLERFSVSTTLHKSKPGYAPTETEVQDILSSAVKEGKPYKVVFVTHVDTSVSVRSDVEMVIRLGHQYGALTVVDGVCATGGERFEFSKWNADVYLTASQKVLSLPAGLALMVVSPRALQIRDNLDAKNTPPAFMDWKKWQPIMQAYEEQRPSYWATPATTLAPALDVTLEELLPIDSVFENHARFASAFRAGIEALGLKFVAQEPEIRANTLTAVHVPKGIQIAQFIANVKGRGVQVAGPLLQNIDPYFRVGHMGYTTHVPEYLFRTLNAIEGALLDLAPSLEGESLKKIQQGTAQAAAQAVLNGKAQL